MADDRVFLALVNAKAAIDELKERSCDPRVPRPAQLVAAIEAAACERQLDRLNRDVQPGG